MSRRTHKNQNHPLKQSPNFVYPNLHIMLCRKCCFDVEHVYQKQEHSPQDNSYLVAFGNALTLTMTDYTTNLAQHNTTCFFCEHLRKYHNQ